MTGVCKYVLIYCNCKLILNVLYLVNIYVAVVTYTHMIHKKDNTHKFGWSLSMYDTGVRDSWRASFVLDESVVKINLLANRSTHWPVGDHQV